MLNKVVVGKGAKSGISSALKRPPPGYDSVSLSKAFRSPCTHHCHRTSIKVIIDNGHVNDELVVFTNDAIRPVYLLMYDA